MNIEMENLNVIYRIISGSHAYGTTTETSGTDIRGIFLPSIRECLGLDSISTFTDVTKDIMLHPIQKYARLLASSNPSIIEWLFVPPTCIEVINPAFDLFIKRRFDFLSKNIYRSYKGYANDEYARIFKLTGKTGNKRRECILENGYNTKSAMHVVRLLAEGIEILRTGKLTMPCPNAKLLLDIKVGNKGFSTVKSIIVDLEKELDEAFAESPLQAEVPYDLINDTMIDVILSQDK